MNTMEEIWKDIEGYYQVSNKGKVRSIDRYIDHFRGGKRLLKGKIIKPGLSVGYENITLYLDGKRKHKKVHRLIAETFIPNPENKKCVNHKDGNKLNNNVSNLEWCTYAENNRHAHETGLTTNYGESHPQSKLKAEDIPNILHMSNTGMSHKKIGDELGVSAITIFDVIHGNTWKHIPR